jgi:hypothetical protein
MSRYNWLHTAISSPARLALVADTPLAEIISAPAHTKLRNPEAVLALAARIERGDDSVLGSEPILIGIFTSGPNHDVKLRSVECLDGHHRLVAALIARKWGVLGDAPLPLLDVRVNGWRENGVCEDRWVPLHAAERARIPHSRVTGGTARGETAAIAGDISALDSRFAADDRGVPLARIAAALAP